MKFLASVVALSFAATVSAQAACQSVAAQIPACGTGCIESAGSAVGCASTDFACQCSTSNLAAINSAALACVVQSCGAVTGLEVSTAALAVCACAATAAPAGPASTSASTPASTSAAAPASSASSAAPSTAAAGSSSAAPVSSYPAASVTSAASTSAAAAASSSAAAPASSSAAAGNGTVPFTSGQNFAQPMGAAAAVIALFVGVLALL